MWAIIVFLTIGLYNMFKHPQNIQQKNNISFSKFLEEVDNGRVVQVDIQGNNINGILSDGKKFSTYAPNKKFLDSITTKGYKYKFYKVKTLNKVLVGPFKTEKEARNALRVIRKDIEAGAFLTRMYK